MRRRDISDYLLSLPERVLRSATALAAGLLRETGDVAVPGFLRRTRLYRTLVESTLRFLIEQVGQVEGAYPNEEQIAENFLVRRTAGNGLELVGVLAFHASPVWVLAALADISGAGRQLIGEIAATLKQEGLLAPDAEIGTVEQMLDGIERVSGRVAETVNTPPLDVAALRTEWAEIRAAAASIPAPSLPTAAEVWRTWTDFKAEAATQGRSVWELSSLVGLGALTRLGHSAVLATRRTGEVFAGALLAHYRDALGEIHERGYLRYVVTEFRPYLRAAAMRFSPRERSWTEKLLRRSAPVLLLCSLLPAYAQAPAIRGTPPPRTRPAPAVRTAASLPAAVSPRVLESHVSFLASDLMQGRATPSRELDLAAEYIAAQFRRIGLKPAAAGGDYFETTAAEFTITAADQTTAVPVASIRNLPPEPFDVPLAKVTSAEGPRPRAAVFTTPEIAAALKPPPRMLIVLTSPGGDTSPADAIAIDETAARTLYDNLPAGRADARAFYVPAGLKNVIGVLPGTDPALRDEYVLVTAHYDHVGLAPASETGDRIFNGANDNASGVAGMIEAAASLAGSARQPRRSIVFMAMFGEERGLLGSTYYARHPVFPLDKTVAMINLEQLGRTEDTDGKRVAAVAITGLEFSEAGPMLRAAMALAGVKVQNPSDSDDYFHRSDNLALANAGVPAHTLAVAFQFPDYHKPSDEWPKLDYDNMAAVTRAVAAGALAIANRTEAPRWLTTNPKAEPYRRRTTPLAAPRAASARESGSSPANPKPRQSAPSRRSP